MSTKSASNANADTRKELAELIKRKAEISVNRKQYFKLFTNSYSKIHNNFFSLTWRDSSDKSSPSKAPISRTRSSTATSSVAGIAISPPTRAQTPKPTSAIESSKKTSDSSASRVSHRRRPSVVSSKRSSRTTRAMTMTIYCHFRRVFIIQRWIPPLNRRNIIRPSIVIRRVDRARSIWKSHRLCTPTRRLSTNENDLSNNNF